MIVKVIVFEKVVIEQVSFEKLLKHIKLVVNVYMKL